MSSRAKSLERHNQNSQKMLKKKGISVGAFMIGKRKADELLARPAGMPPSKRSMETPPANLDTDQVEDESGSSSDDEESRRKKISEMFNSSYTKVASPENSDEEVDPLDSFMAQIENEVEQQKHGGGKKQQKAIRDDIEQEDDQETFFKAVQQAIIVDHDEEELEYDSDGNPVIPDHAKVINPLPPIDHDEIDYPPFHRNFYHEHSEIAAMTHQDVQSLRKKLGLSASGYHPPKPCVSFAHFGFDKLLMGAIRKSEFTSPTPIQSQAIPAALSGRDVIGIAKTGSGKTVAYLWPLLVHIMDQPELKEGDGPVGLVCAPTRELCQQIYHEARKFSKVYGLRVCAVYGGSSKWEQTQDLKQGAEIVVATPGRLIDLVKSKAVTLTRVTFLVMDEADRMFDMGFEPQVRSIANHVRPDRQTLLFSATFRKKVEKLCRDILTDPVRIVVGALGEANTDITQVAMVMTDQQSKWSWLLNNLVQLISTGGVLLFVTRKLDSEQVAANLQIQGYSVGLLHGDMTQGNRDDVIAAFKQKKFPILIATDVAARGLDIPLIKTVINYDVAKTIDTHTHRIGRTGRAGEKGTAFTLLTNKDVHFAAALVRNLEQANQNVPDDLMQLAMQNTSFKRSRSKQKGEAIQPRKLRPGLGADLNTTKAAAKQQSSFIKASSGPSGERLSSLKEAYQARYKTSFQAASNQSMMTSNVLPSQPPPQPVEITKKKRKSRWD